MTSRWSPAVVPTALALLIYLISTDHLPPHGPAPLPAMAGPSAGSTAAHLAAQAQPGSDGVTLLPRTGIAAPTDRDIAIVTLGVQTLTSGLAEHRAAAADAGRAERRRPDRDELQVLRC